MVYIMWSIMVNHVVCYGISHVALWDTKCYAGKLHQSLIVMKDLFTKLSEKNMNNFFCFSFQNSNHDNKCKTVSCINMTLNKLETRSHVFLLYNKYRQRAVKSRQRAVLYNTFFQPWSQSDRNSLIF